MNIDVKSIKPKRSKISDKYSWNLYQFLKKHPHYRVFWMEKDRFFGDLVKFSEIERARNISSHIVIGYSTNTYSGAFLGDIMQKSNPTTWSLMLYDPKWFTDITDWFIDMYQKIGRCAFDPKHTAWYKGDEDRFIEVTNNTKKCRWCGEWFEKKIEKRVEIKRYERWVSQKKSKRVGG